MKKILVTLALRILKVHPYEWDRLTFILNCMRICKKQSESMKDGIIVYEFDTNIK